MIKVYTKELGTDADNVGSLNMLYQGTQDIGNHTSIGSTGRFTCLRLWGDSKVKVVSAGTRRENESQCTHLSVQEKLFS